MRALRCSLALCGLALALAACGRGELEALLSGGGDAGSSSGDGSIASDSGDGSIGDRGPGDGPVAASLRAIQVTPPEVSLVLGTRQALIATGIFDDGSTADLTSVATWLHEGDAVQVSMGVVVAVRPGEAVVRAQVGAVSGTARVRVSELRVVSLVVTPAMTRAPTGVEVRFIADATLSDGSHQDVTTSVSWSSGDPGVADIGPSGVATTRRPGVTVIRAVLGSLEGRAVLEVSAARLLQIQVEPVDPTVAIGTVLELHAIGLYSDMSTADLSAQVTWQSSAPDVLALDGRGLGRALAEGTAVVTAELDGVRGSSTVTVSAATLVALRIDPDTSVIGVMGTVQLRAIGAFSDGSIRDLTTSVAWSSTDAMIASVSSAAGSQGLVTGVSPGTAEIQARFAGQAARALVTVSSAMIVRIEITPAQSTVAVGGTAALRAIATFSDGTRRDVTEEVAWSSDDPRVATISNVMGGAGVVTGVAAGMTSVEATLDGVTARAVVVVSAAGLLGIDVTPANAVTTAGLRSSYTATGRYADGTTRDLTTQVTWTTGDAAIATISNVAGARGQLLARGPGTTRVIATLMGTSGSTNVTVQGATLASLTITPIARQAPVGTVIQYTAVAIYSDGTQRNVTGQVVWSSSSPGIASISAQGRAQAMALGVTTISATFMGIMGSTSLTVTEAQLVAVSLSPAAISLTVGAVQHFSAQGIFSDGTSRSVTQQATWQSSDPAVAQVTSNGRRGDATALSLGVTTISATVMGVTGTAALTVTSAQITSIQITPFAPMLVVGGQLQLQAVAIFSDGTSMDVTTRATWVSSSPAIAAVSTGGRAGMRGLTTGLALGSATITATFMGISGSTTVTVTSATVVQIQITPFGPTIPLGIGANLRATALLSDGTTRDVTFLATWTSGSPQVAQVSNAGMSKGQVTTLSVGSAVVQASYLGSSGSTTVTVTNDVLQTIEIVPGMLSIGVAETLPLQAIGHFSGGTSLDLTELVTWQSSAPMVADVANVAGARGQVTGLSLGAATIEARRGGLVGSAFLSVN